VRALAQIDVDAAARGIDVGVGRLGLRHLARQRGRGLRWRCRRLRSEWGIESIKTRCVLVFFWEPIARFFFNIKQASL
jgi:hypothetical protein